MDDDDFYTNYLTDETMDEMDEYDEPNDDIDESFEWESSMASAGWGTDEDYGYYGEEY